MQTKNIQAVSALLLITMAMSIVGFAQGGKASNDYLAVPGPIVFDTKSFSLSWSAHPAANFYKQEYLQKGTDANEYKTMILLDVVTGEQIKSVVSAKIEELKRMKEINPIVNYEIIQNPKTGEYLLDFLLTANAADGSITVVERNVYRYKSFTVKTGATGVQLFGVSTRAYGADVTSFLTGLKQTRRVLVGKVAAFTLPIVTI